MVMMSNQEPDEYLTKVLQQRDELEHIGKSFTEARILDFILEGLSDEYKPVRFVAERDPKTLLKEIEITMRNMHANRVTRGGTSNFLREKRRESAMTASSGFNGSCDVCNSAIMTTAAPNNNNVATVGVATTPATTTIVETVANTFTATGLTRTEPTRQSQSTVRLRPCHGCSSYFPGCSDYCSTCSGYCSTCSGYCDACSGYFSGCSYAVQRH